MNFKAEKLKTISLIDVCAVNIANFLSGALNSSKHICRNLFILPLALFILTLCPPTSSSLRDHGNAPIFATPQNAWAVEEIIPAEETNLPDIPSIAQEIEYFQMDDNNFSNQNKNFIALNDEDGTKNKKNTEDSNKPNAKTTQANDSLNDVKKLLVAPNSSEKNSPNQAFTMNSDNSLENTAKQNTQEDNIDLGSATVNTQDNTALMRQKMQQPPIKNTIQSEAPNNYNNSEEPIVINLDDNALPPIPAKKNTRIPDEADSDKSDPESESSLQTTSSLKLAPLPKLAPPMQPSNNRQNVEITKLPSKPNSRTLAAANDNNQQVIATPADTSNTSKKGAINSKQPASNQIMTKKQPKSQEKNRDSLNRNKKTQDNSNKTAISGNKKNQPAISGNKKPANQENNNSIPQKSALKLPSQIATASNISSTKAPTSLPPNDDNRADQAYFKQNPSLKIGDKQNSFQAANAAGKFVLPDAAEQEALAFNKSGHIVERPIFSHKNEYLPSKIFNKQQSPNNKHLPKSISEEDMSKFLFIAAKAEDIQGIKALLSKGVNINAQESQKSLTPLAFAIDHNKTRAARYLVLRGADPKITNNEGQNALHLAAMRNNYEIMNLLISMVPELIHKTDAQGKRPTEYIGKKLDIAMARKILNFYKNPNLALSDFVKTGSVIGAKLALIQGAEINYIPDSSSNHDNLGMIAISHKNSAMLGFLLENGLNIDYKNKKNENLYAKAKASAFNPGLLFIETALLKRELHQGQ